MIFDEKFVQSLVLLLFTALLTGLVVPYVLRIVDARKTREQKDREAGLARQAKVVEAQSKFLDDLSDYLWRWRYLAIERTLPASPGGSKHHAKDQQEDERSAIKIFRLVQNEISRSRRLVSDKAYRRLLKLYETDLVELDVRLREDRARDQRVRGDKLHLLNQYIYHTVSSNIDEVLNDLATELRLRASGQDGDKHE